MMSTVEITSFIIFITKIYLIDACVKFRLRQSFQMEAFPGIYQSGGGEVSPVNSMLCMPLSELLKHMVFCTWRCTCLLSYPSPAQEGSEYLLTQ